MSTLAAMCGNALSWAPDTMKQRTVCHFQQRRSAAKRLVGVEYVTSKADLMKGCREEHAGRQSLGSFMETEIEYNACGRTFLPVNAHNF